MPEHLNLFPQIPCDPIENQHIYMEQLDPRRHGPEMWDTLGLENAERYLAPLGGAKVRTERQFIKFLQKIPGARKPFNNLRRKYWKPRRGRSMTFVTRSKKSGKIVGMRGYFNVNCINGTAEVGNVMTLPGSDRKAVKHAQNEVHKLVFGRLGYRRIYSYIHPDNYFSIRLSASSGYDVEGTERANPDNRQGLTDMVLMSMTLDDWPAVERGYELALEDKNFDENGKQIKTVREFINEFQLS